MNKLVSVLFLFCLTGCAQKGQKEFYELVKSHRDLTIETNASIIASIQDELDLNKNLTVDEVRQLQVLRDRLVFGAKQSDVINRYINTYNITPEFIQELIRSTYTKQEPKNELFRPISR